MAQRIDQVPGSPAERPSADAYSRSLNLAVMVALGAVFIISVVYRPPDEPYFTICGFKTLTGLPCPGCGLTHSFCAIGKGEMLRALGFNLLGPFVFLLTAVAWVRSALVLAGRLRPVALIDALLARFRLVRHVIISLGIYGCARIVWLLIHPSSELQNSLFLKLVAWLKG